MALRRPGALGIRVVVKVIVIVVLAGMVPAGRGSRQIVQRQGRRAGHGEGRPASRDQDAGHFVRGLGQQDGQPVVDCQPGELGEDVRVIGLAMGPPPRGME